MLFNAVCGLSWFNDLIQVSGWCCSVGGGVNVLQIRVDNCAIVFAWWSDLATTLGTSACTIGAYLSVDDVRC